MKETLARARVLAEQLERPEHLVPLILGQWSLHHVRSERRLALPLAEHLQQIGEMRNDAAGQSLSRYAQGVTRLTLGEFAGLLGEFNLALSNHDAAKWLDMMRKNPRGALDRCVTVDTATTGGRAHVRLCCGPNRRGPHDEPA